MIEKRKKRRKIFYVPGIISLVFIPILCLISWYKTDVFKEERSIDLSFPGESLTKPNILSFKRNYKVFSFNSSEVAENQDLKNLQFALRKLNKENDTINGVQIHLGNKMKYEVYIRLLDIFAIEKMPNFEQYNNDFFVLMVPKPKYDKNLREIVPITCGYWEANKDHFLKMEKEKQFEYVLTLYKKYWFLFLAYIGIVFLNIFALVKFNKTR